MENAGQIYLSARSNHEKRPNGFGGYPLYIDLTQKKMFFKKEETHEQGYSSRLASVNIHYKEGEWFKAKVRITNIENGKVGCEGWFNDKMTLVIDSGQIECGNDTHPKRKAPPFTGIGESCFLRVNSISDQQNVKVKYRNTSIKAI